MELPLVPNTGIIVFITMTAATTAAIVKRVVVKTLSNGIPPWRKTLGPRGSFCQASSWRGINRFRVTPRGRLVTPPGPGAATGRGIARDLARVVIG